MALELGEECRRGHIQTKATIVKNAQGNLVCRVCQADACQRWRSKVVHGKANSVG